MSAVRPVVARLGAASLASAVLLGAFAAPALADDNTEGLSVETPAAAPGDPSSENPPAVDPSVDPDVDPDGDSGEASGDSAQADEGTTEPTESAGSAESSDPGSDSTSGPASDPMSGQRAAELAAAKKRAAAAQQAAASRAARAVAVARTRSAKVFVVGDSLTVGAAPGIYRGLKHQVAGVTVNGRVGRFVSEGLRFLPKRKERIWVVALGTNDGPSYKRTLDWVNWVMRKAGQNRKVILVNVVRPGGYSATNAAIRTANLRHQNLSVVDWAGYVRKHAWVISGDRVHATGVGYAIRARLIAQEVLRVAGQP